MIFGAAFALVAALAARPAAAQQPLPGLPEQLLDGALAVAGHPGTLMTLAPLGVLLGLWRPDGARRTVPALFAGLVLGVFVAPALGPYGLSLALLGTALLAFLGLAARRLPGWVVQAVTLAVGALSAAAVIGPRGAAGLPQAALAGLGLGALILPAAASGVVVASLRWINDSWLRVVWMVGLSWIGALSLILAAFRLR
ncbi:MAG: hypothetical protein ACLFQL_04535 [Paracoccaceae bacterium]